MYANLFLFVIPDGFEPSTHSLEGCCSIQLSYGTNYIYSRTAISAILFKKIEGLDSELGVIITLYPKLIPSILSGWQDSNLRPPGPKPGALAGLRYTPNFFLLFPHHNCAEREGFEPSVRFNTYDSLANCSFRPLRHLSLKGRQRYKLNFDFEIKFSKNSLILY